MEGGQKKSRLGALTHHIYQQFPVHVLSIINSIILYVAAVTWVSGGGLILVTLKRDRVALWVSPNASISGEIVEKK